MDRLGEVQALAGDSIKCKIGEIRRLKRNFVALQLSEKRIAQWFDL
jgi:hypothetical protein